jgi:hypothetical protein
MMTEVKQSSCTLNFEFGVLKALVLHFGELAKVQIENVVRHTYLRKQKLCEVGFSDSTESSIEV